MFDLPCHSYPFSAVNDNGCACIALVGCPFRLMNGASAMARRKRPMDGDWELEPRIVPSNTPPALVRDINIKPLDSSPANIFDLHGTTIFLADDGIHGQELWTTDGT